MAAPRRMRSDSQLDYAIFQLTPTRTRCELLLAAQGSTYKLASGLLNPFISHLKSAEEQLARGGYSIRLEPPDPGMTPWFTKATMERFVRFVSTPELLERVSTVEAELIELDETSDRQNTAEACETNGHPGQAENQLVKAPANPSPGGKSMAAANSDKLSKSAHDATETGVEEGSKHLLLRALEARRMMLQKEQGMAFARALAAGFSPENMADLVQFCECFGATRLREACIKFMALYKKRQEAGLAIEEIDFAASSQAEMAAYLSSAGIEGWLNTPHPDVVLASSENGAENPNEAVKGNGDAVAGAETGKGNPMLSPPWQGLPQNLYMQNGLHHPGPYGAMPYGFSPQALPGQPGLSYPQYMAGPYMPPQLYSHMMPPQYWPGPHPESTSSPVARAKVSQERIKAKLNGKEEYGDDDDDDDEDNGDVDGDAIEETLSDEAIMRPTKASMSARRRRSASPMRRVQLGHSAGSKRSGMVVIRNINYIASKTPKRDEDDEDEDEDEDEDDNKNNGSYGSEDDLNAEDGNSTFKVEAFRGSLDEAVGLVKSLKHGQKDGKPKSTKKGAKKSSSKGRGMTSNAVPTSGYDSDSGKESDNESARDSDTGPTREDQKNNTKHNKLSNELRNSTAEEGDLFVDRARQKNSISLVFDTSELEYKKVEQTADSSDKKGYSTEDMVIVTQSEFLGKGTAKASQQPFDMLAEQDQQLHHKQMAVMDDQSMVVIPENRSATTIREDVIADSENRFSFKAVDTKLSDESFILVDRSTPSEGSDNRHKWRSSLSLDSEMPLDIQSGHGVDASGINAADQVSTMVEPQELFMFPDRSKDAYKRTWDSVDYDMQALAAAMVENEPEDQAQDDTEVAEEGTHEQGGESTVVTKKTVSKVASEKDAKAKAMKEILERRRSIFGSGRVAPGRSNPLAEAQLRAEKLRAYKADLQKSKKEKEEEDRKRIENLKNQRKERIAARTLSAAPALNSSSMNRADISITPPSKPIQKLHSSTSSVSPRDNKVSSAARLARLSSPKSIDAVIAKETLRKSAPALSTLLRPSSDESLKAAPSKKKPSTATRQEEAMETSAHGKGNNAEMEDEKAVRTAASLDRIDAKSSVGKAPPNGRTNVTTVKKSVVSDSVDVPSSNGFAVSGGSAEKAVTESTGSENVDEKKAAIRKGGSVSGATVVANPPKPSAAIAEAKQAKKAPPVAMERKKASPPAPRTKAAAVLVPEKIPEAAAQVSEPSRQEDVLLDHGITPMAAAEPLLEALKSSDAAASGHATATQHEKANPRNDPAHVPSKAVEPLPKMKAVDDDASPKVTASGADEVAELEREEISSLPQGYGLQALVAHASSPENISIYDVKADPPVIIAKDRELLSCEEASPHFSPSPITTPSPYHTNLANFDGSAQSDSNHDGSSRARKKWGDSKAKGLKKLLLLGRKSKRQDPNQSPSSSDMVIVQSEEAEEEEAQSDEARPNKDSDRNEVSGSNPVVPLQSKSEGNSSSKGSRSFFSLSLRGRSNAVKA